MPPRRVYLVGLVATLLLVLWLAGWTEPGALASIDAARAALLVLLKWGPLAVAWLLAAVGFGRPLRAFLAPRVTAPVCVQVVLGVAALLVIDSALARAGLLGSSLGWIVLGMGIGVLADQIWRNRKTLALPPLPPIALASVVPIAVLITAALSAPGWLWASEFGGYDALSYHLQLPREWNALGIASGLEHNVYSFLPSYAETAFMHLFAISDNRLGAAYACQLLHVGITLIASIVTGRLAITLTSRTIGSAVPAIVLGTPWVIVVGSLAYNEMIVSLMLAGALLLVLGESIDATRGWRCGLAIGILLGAACGAKPPAAVLVVAPVVVLLMLRPGACGRERYITFGTAAFAGAVALAPALVSNALNGGNPVFPFLTSVFGAAHWDPEQVRIWTVAHGGGIPLGDRVHAAWDQLFRYGFGAPPAPREPWAPQWSILPWLTIIAGAFACTRASTRPIAWRLLTVLVIQFVLWIAMTHVKSRFMVPAVVPAALLLALTAHALHDALASRPATRALGVAGMLAVLAYASAPAALFKREARGRPAAAIDGIPSFAEDDRAARLEAPGLSGPERALLLTDASPAFWINHRLDDDAVVLLVGDATPFYYRPPSVRYQTTWDRGPFSRALATTTDDAALVAQLRHAGITHVLVNPIMLRLWEDEGWNDPALTAQRVFSACELHMREVNRFPGGARLYELR